MLVSAFERKRKELVEIVAIVVLEIAVDIVAGTEVISVIAAS